MQQDQRKKSSKEADFFTEYGDANRYKILEVIGKGSYGVVCAAIDTHTGEKVAIKKITDIFEHISDAIRILREVKLLRLLRHPDIVEIKRIMLPPSKRDFRDIYVVFELMESDLHQVIKANDDLTHEHHRFFLYQMLRALKYMHTANVYHRDLKPKNVLANANCKLKICDFGLARVSFSDTPTTIFWTDYVATRWYRAPELCGSFFSKINVGLRVKVLRNQVLINCLLDLTMLDPDCIYTLWEEMTLLQVELSVLQYTPAIDIWSIGCIFAEVLTGRPLFPGKSVVHQLELITDLLGTPSADIISGVRNEKARKYLTDMRKKQPVSFAEKFPNADPLALQLLQRLLAFDPKDRPTAEEALADPYFKGLAKIEREPSCLPISKLEFEFERRRLTKEDIRELIFREILEYHPQLLKDYMAGNDGANFLYPSAIGHFRKQFAYLEENGGKSGPVIPPERKHVSLPRSTVNSSVIPPKTNPIQSAFDRRISEEVSTTGGLSESNTGNLSKGLRPPPRVPPAKPGRVVGPVLPYENVRNNNDAYNGRVYIQNAVLPPQAISPQYFFKTPNNGKNQDKQQQQGGEAIKETSQAKLLQQQQPQHYPPAAKSTPAVSSDINNHHHHHHHHLHHQTHLYYQSQAKAMQLNSQLAIDAKLLQAQSQFGAVGAAAVAVAAHREVGIVQYGLT